MIVKPIKTHKITQKDNLEAILDKYLPKIGEETIVVVTSKIVSICEGRIVPIEGSDKNELIKEESEFYLPKGGTYDLTLTVNQNSLRVGAGVDESNGNGFYILFPKDPQKSANRIRDYLKKKFNIKKIGVLLTDSRTKPLRWGITGEMLSHSGFKAINNKIGKLDLFGRKLKMTQINVADELSDAAAAVMGESDEQTPLAIITDIPFVSFQDHNPTKEELKLLNIELTDDVYAPLLTSVKWLKGKK